MNQILDQMEKIVLKKVENFKTDFYDYDKITYGRMYENTEFIFLTRKNGTYILGIPKNIKDEQRKKNIRDTSLSILNYYTTTDSSLTGLYFIIKDKSINKINIDKAYSLVMEN